MKLLKRALNILKGIAQGTPEWHSFREGKITGTKLATIFAKKRGMDDYDTSKRSAGFWEIVAERLAVGVGDDGNTEEGLGSSRERGKDLEEEAFERCKEELGLKDLVRGGVWITPDPNHIHSPDAYTPDGEIAAEIKCPKSAVYIEAVYEDNPYKMGSAYLLPQYTNYFLTNPALKKLIVFWYDPRFIVEGLQWHAWEITREMMLEKISRMTEVKDEALAQIDAVVKEIYKKYSNRGGK